MKTFAPLMLISMCVVLSAAAGDKPGEVQDWMREALAKDRTRATEAMQNHANTARLEEKFGWAKEKHPDQFAALMSANRKAADSWAAVAKRAETATHPDAVADVKQVANEASGAAYLAEMALKYVASAAERGRTLEKYKNSEVSSLASRLNANERAIYEANRLKNEAAANVEKLLLENKALGKAFQEACSKAKASEKPDHERHEAPKDPSRLPPKEPAREPFKQPTGGGAPNIE
ncbi:MAG TPA: hypothetical protein VFY13_05850 [Luteolibacter sp.]|nr:hypothetical protein [Luteolibacter sp.]